MELVIISDTPIYKVAEGYVVFEPTLREVEHVSAIFDEIIWYGMVKDQNPHSLLFRLPTTEKIKIRSLPRAVGGRSYWEKLAIIPGLPLLIYVIGIQFFRFRYIHTRGPSLPALIAILYSKLFRNKVYWHKYAGNWNQENPPLSYRIQRQLLRRSEQRVTVNGFWNEANSNILSFENPCFSRDELRVASESCSRDFSQRKYKFVFVGRLEKEKGVHLVIDAARSSPEDYEWYVVGDGKDREMLIDRVKGIRNIHFLGALNRNQLNDIYKQAHFLILPTIASEGFPKVISEACGYGCVPVVSLVSSIGQYVKPDFAFLLQEVSLHSIQECIHQIGAKKEDQLLLMSRNAIEFAQLFTYERFVERIKDEVFEL